MIDRAGLEIRYTLFGYRGFESLTLRKQSRRESCSCRFPFFYKKTMKKIVFIMVAALLATACQESLEDRCEREAREYTEKHCPTPVGKNIVLDSMTFDKKSHTIQYAYTLSGQIDDSATINKSNPRELLLQEVRNSTNLKLYKEAGYSFTYTYYSAKNKGTQLFKATFRKSDYQ